MAALNVAGMMEAAKTRADTFNIYVKTQTTFFEKRLTDFTNDNAKNLAIPTQDTAGLETQEIAVDSLSKDMREFASKISQATKDVKANMAQAEAELVTTNDLLDNLEKKDYASLNATSKRLLQDSATNYKQTFIAVCVKAGVCLLLLYFLWEHWFNVLVIFGGITVVWVLISAIIFIWGQTIKKPSAAAAPTSKGDADTCKNDNYMRLATVCRDGTPKTGDCATTNLCWDTEFGCCADKVTPKKSATDVCGLTPCETTLFGCCPNGVPKIDQLGSNCTDTALCGSSPWGCNLDGTFITARLASELKNTLPKLNAEQEAEKEKQKCEEVLGKSGD